MASYRRNDSRRLDANHVINADFEGYQSVRRAVEQGQSHDRRGKARKTGTRKRYQEKRFNANRKEKSTVSVNDLSEELRKSLFPGI